MIVNEFQACHENIFGRYHIEIFIEYFHRVPADTAVPNPGIQVDLASYPISSWNPSGH
jgi:hypothetical protein